MNALDMKLISKKVNFQNLVMTVNLDRLIRHKFHQLKLQIIHIGVEGFGHFVHITCQIRSVVLQGVN